MNKTGIALLMLVLMVCCLTGCQRETAPKADAYTAEAATVKSGLSDYMADVRAQSDAIRLSLEKDALTQTDMNQKSKALCDLWECAMNRLLEEARRILPEAELDRLNAEQTDWEADMIAAVETAGREYEGGTIHALVVNNERAKLVEERVNKLYELLK